MDMWGKIIKSLIVSLAIGCIAIGFLLLLGLTGITFPIIFVILITVMFILLICSLAIFTAIFVYVVFFQ